ncbi:MAG TPA: ATP-dependent RecD-like DNA helicase [Candidatus Spyradosoma merdigallinarum]|uniref:ATP-dependent RecD-like DNA helicase n=1 Tax=Candidatus Spyradosoma merdigallinarum TaxID=2840950 RepID=A0A9D1NKC5_9BACT|nr:ATP-dependent RecD-like DNA helicase [Candidatus Spyradosoma merdigallinarum]
MALPRKDVPAAKEDTLVGVLERIIFFNDENFFTIGEVFDEATREKVVVAGALPSVQCGETLELRGAWTSHPAHGRQFRISSFASRLPSSVHGIRKFLGSGLVRGIGKTYAGRIVDRFGADTLRVISHESARLREIPGIGEQRARAIKNSWDEQFALREIMIFLQTYGVTTAQCLRIVKAYGADAKKVLQENPYRLAQDIDGIAFPTADKIAANLGLPTEGEQRAEAGVAYAMQLAEADGHTAFPQRDLEEKAAELLGVDPGVPAALVRKMLENGRLVRAEGVQFSRGADGSVSREFVPLLQKKDFAAAEREIAACVSALAGTPDRLPPIRVENAVAWAQRKAGFAFAPEQAAAVKTALSEKFSIVTGGPGTGKTTILRALCAILRAKNVRVTLAAPTGRAAQRMSEAAGVAAGTIHRILRPDPATGGFSHNEKNPLPTDFVVVDEASMLDTKLAAALFRAVPPSAHLVLVGDVHQLPSVGPGNVLKDLMRSRRAAVTKLNAVFRQGSRSGIVAAAHAVLQGDAHVPQPVSESVFDFDPEGDLHFIRATGAEDCVNKTIALATQAIPRLLGIRSADDIQVIVPMHRGNAGVRNFNAVLQKAFKPGRGNEGVPAAGGTRLELGDKVLQNRNNYEKNVFNGDLGRIDAVSAEDGSVGVRFAETHADYERGELGELQLAYAITIHKSQGSEFPVVVIPLVKAHFMMLKRNLIYTALTRGRKHVFVVGEPAAYSMAARNADSARRWTGLLARLAK